MGRVALVAFDTATPSLSLALADDEGRLLASWTTRVPRLHARMLHPLLDEMMEHTGLAPEDLHGVAVGVGPGSYTGVRIGVTAAKTLAYARRIPLAGVSSLAAAALPARAAGPALLAVAWDARRGDVYGGAYRAAGESGACRAALREVVSEDRLAVGELARKIADELARAGETSVALAGDGAGLVLQALADRAVDAVVWESAADVRAEHVLALGFASLRDRLQAGEEGVHEREAHTLSPRYLQLAEAEARLRLAQRRGSDAGGT